MPEHTDEAGAGDATVVDVEDPLTVRAVLASFVAGAAGLAAMAPVIAGVPILLGVFRADPLARFARLVVADANATLGVALFVAGGAVVLPLFFLATSSFLPPARPRYARAVTLAVLFWVSFAFVFWPGGGAVTVVAFAVLTLLAHVVYGLVLGLVLDRLTGIPEHDV